MNEQIQEEEKSHLKVIQVDETKAQEGLERTRKRISGRNTERSLRRGSR
ncbi:hypothetical protein [Leptospira interrogans]|nr:hypothetical protein [Leptospira interrogans]